MKGDVATGNQPPAGATAEELARLRAECARLALERDGAFRYVRDKVNQMLTVMGTIPLKPEELDDATLVEVDPIGIVAESFDRVIGHLHKTNGSLRLAHEDLKAVFDSTAVGVLVVRPDRTVVSCNRVVEEMTGRSRDGIAGAKCFEIICGECPPLEECALLQAYEARKRVRRERIAIRGRVFDAVATPVFDEADEIEHLVLAYIDTTDQLNALRKLAESEIRYRELFENANDLILATDPDGALLYANRAWRAALGVPEDDGLPARLSEFLSPESETEFFRKVADARAAPNEPVRLSAEFVARDGRQILADGSLSCARDAALGQDTIRCFFRDVTLERRMEGEIAKMQRLESLGFLAGGIAHDFNNILTAALGNVSLAKLYEQRGFPTREKIEKAEEAILRARGLTQRLLTFAQGGDPVRRGLALGGLARTTLEFALHGTPVKLDFAEEGELADVWGDPRLIEQVFCNIAANAIQAMPQGGALTVRCRNVAIGKDAAYPLPEGDYVSVELADEGPGIAPEVLGRIFDPFFTTRADGAGLGLSSAYSILLKHGGFLGVSSPPGRGAAFTALLPVDTQEKVSPQAASEEGQAPRGGRILLMDDEEAILDLLKSLLESSGFDVAVATDGAQAIALYGKALGEGKPFDLFITDLTVPGGMGGLEAMGRIRQLDPDVLGIVSSGYSTDPVMTGYRKYGFHGVAVKPYRLESLLELIRRLMSERRAGVA